MLTRALFRWLDYLADLVVIVPVGWWLAYAISRINGFLGALEVLVTLFYLTIGTPVWVYLRMAPRLAKLAANRDFRRELAVTPLPADRFLRGRLFRPLLTSMLVLVVADPVALAPVMWQDGSLEAKELLKYVILLGLPFVGLVMGLYILSRIFVMLLNRPGGENRGLLIGIGGFFLTGLSVFGFYFLLILLVSQWLGETGFFALSLLGIGGAGLLLIPIRRNWRRCCVLFYTLDDPLVRGPSP